MTTAELDSLLSKLRTACFDAEKELGSFQSMRSETRRELRAAIRAASQGLDECDAGKFAEPIVTMPAPGGDLRTGIRYIERD